MVEFGLLRVEIRDSIEVIPDMGTKALGMTNFTRCATIFVITLIKPRC